ncbi:MAG TPA: 4Fe-4S dicluster domain-containing protein, partial [Planctomycetota bacterium]|nr:4Fe-4S dicluster domain-containing protein [Planctomycetota bacterium]
QEADVVLSLDADVLSSGPGRERYAHDYAVRRREGGGSGGPSRLYVAESTPSPTGAAADHRFPVRSSDVEGISRMLARSLGIEVPASDPSTAPTWIAAVAADLRRAAGRSLVIAGRDQTAAVQALAAVLNQELGNAGKTVEYIDPIVQEASPGPSGLPDLARALAAGEVSALVILGGNPAYDAPADLELGRLFAAAPFRVHLALVADETSRLCLWHLPRTHFLEEWGDALAFDGTATILQPLIAPLYGGRGVHELLSLLNRDPGRRSYDVVRSHWAGTRKGADFEDFWQSALHDGVVPATAHAPLALRPVPGALQRPPGRSAPASDVELVFRPDPSVFDGRGANNAWLQELPKPLTSLTWENAALLGPALGARLGLATGDLVELTLRGRRVHAPVLLLPGHADRSVTVTLGYGRTQAGRIGTGLGYSAYRLRTRETPLFGTELGLRKLGARVQLATTQLHHSMEGREPARERSIGDPEESPDERARDAGPDSRATLYPQVPASGPAWGMLIDLGACTHCNACVLACQVENNVPTVGKSQVLQSREMHWLRIDDYVAGPPGDPRMLSQPVPCMHCENAPCELVCPVNATTHSREGLNQMTYNRCVGTRYCSNNCPYKVRRFNFFQFADRTTPAVQERYNPDVTVRERGVMEKCSYCVQRISHARIDAEKEGRAIRDGDVRTACQQVCPSGAIVFGDVSDPQSHVSRAKARPFHYELLGELGTRPRTTYLARVRNPNPLIKEG